MPELAVVGRAANPEELELEPVVVPVAAYKIETREEVLERFPFKPVMPPGVLAYIERLGGQTAGVNAALLCLADLIVPDASERWTEFLNRGDLAIEATTVAGVLEALMEHYGGRPTRPSSGSPRTGGRTGRTSRGAQRSMA